MENLATRAWRSGEDGKGGGGNRMCGMKLTKWVILVISHGSHPQHVAARLDSDGIDNFLLCLQPLREAAIVKMVNINVGTAADPIVTRLVQEDKVVWYKKPNLRVMYILLFLCCMGVEMTSGFDSQLINTLQYAQTFHECTSHSFLTP